ncbi:MAG TPA: hypothetical protein VE571_15665, partial [Solirubrobacteraceae bacterium]|nr:hypothetical protein [Solirubrobacteraceae bacterium]
FETGSARELISSCDAGVEVQRPVSQLGLSSLGTAGGYGVGGTIAYPPAFPDQPLRRADRRERVSERRCPQ